MNDKFPYDVIYLIPTDYSGDELLYTWCESPAPANDMDEADAIKYCRYPEKYRDKKNQRIAELEGLLRECLATIRGLDVLCSDEVIDYDDTEERVNAVYAMNELRKALAEEHGCDAVVGFIAQHLKETNK